ncbi:MAG: PEP-CTERM sorting domain-containing protein [candidate division Zixibacteria bacterium]|nr:PEP-CTERM sorting domain-containing protein [candidate division Zixibacteria bacterium]
MKKLMLVLGLGLVLLFAPSANASFILTDAFNSFNTTDLWYNPSYNGGWAEVENGYLSLGTTVNVPSGRGIASSLFSLSGNFNTYVDYDLANFNDWYSSASMYMWATDGSFGMRIGRIYLGENHDNYESIYYDYFDGGWQGQHFVSTTDMTGKFRMTRTGDQLGIYYWSGGWTLANSFSTNSASNVTVAFDVASEGNFPPVEAHLDNFYAHADGFANVDSKYLTAAPEPGTFILLGAGLMGLGAVSRIRRKR